MEGVLYYHGCGGVYAFDGSMPQRVSQALGEDEYHGAVAGGADGKYYLSVLDAENQPQLLVYDVRQGLWHREDDLRAVGFAVSGGVLVLSLLHPHTDGEDRAGKVRLYAQAKEFRRRFQEVFGLTRCGDLLRARPGVTERNPASQRLGVTAHCDNMIVTAVEILEQMLQEEPA